MCYEVTFEGETYELVRELRTIAPDLVPDRHYAEPLAEGACLCQVDGAATAATNGFTQSLLHEDPMRVLWKKTESV